MQNLHRIYHADPPAFLQEAAQAPAMTRLKQISMDCGCHYTSFPLFPTKDYYSRYDHSVGVGLILWHFTNDPKQALAGLFHDIAAPVFSHTVDFLNGDHTTQTYTERRTRSLIDESPEIQTILRSLNLTTEDVCDPSLYPLADATEMGHLTADRLEYTMGNFLLYKISDPDLIRTYYQNLTVLTNNDGQPEFGFVHHDYARTFAHLSMQTSRIYSCCECRYTMEFLARTLRNALNRSVLTTNDLWTDEPTVLQKMNKDPQSKAQLDILSRLQDLTITSDPLDETSMQVPGKRRYLDPLSLGQTKRVSELDPLFAQELNNHLRTDFSLWLTAR